MTKKIIVLAFLSYVCLLSVAVAACSQLDATYSCTGSDPNWSFGFSRGVTIGYNVEAVEFRYYTLTTGHFNGDRLFASSQSNTRAYYRFDPTITPEEIAAAASTPASLSPFHGGTGWTAL